MCTSFLFFFFNDTATTEIYTLSLHDALPISPWPLGDEVPVSMPGRIAEQRRDRKSTRLNSSHSQISYAVFCLKKKIIAVVEFRDLFVHSTSSLPSDIAAND